MFGGLWRQTPVMGAFLLFFAFASLGIPGTGNFIGELYVIGGAFSYSPWLGVLSAFGVLFAAAYSLRIFLATMHGVETTAFKKVADTNARENFALGSLAVALVIIGFFPSVITNPLHYPSGKAAPRTDRVTAPLAASAPEAPSMFPAPDAGTHDAQDGHTNLMPMNPPDDHSPAAPPIVRTVAAAMEVR